MALIILEGLDRTGKSSVAQMFERQGYELIHMSAPDKEMSKPGYEGPSYLEQMVEMLGAFSGHNIVLDRSHYGELIWPQVYGRAPLLSDEDIEYLREIEAHLDVTRILMHDPNNEAHWQRCVENNEPLTKPQFVKARSLFSSMADKYGFERKTLRDFPDAEQPLPVSQPKAPVQVPVDATRSERENGSVSAPVTPGSNKTKEQLKLERANIINEVLEKRIIKGKGPVYDEVERSVRHFLNTELGKILGTPAPANASGFSTDEIEILKFFCKTLKDKETR
jgi:hypothetical protein